MSRAYQYHRPRAPDLHVGGPEFGSELDLDDLDPGYKDSSGHPAIREQSSSSRQIPLRELNVGRPGSFRTARQEDQGEGPWQQPLRDASQDDIDDRGFGESSSATQDAVPLLGESDRLGNRSQDMLVRSKGTSARTETSRNITIGQIPPPRFPPNAISNAKYTPWSFLPRTLYNEFSFFFNMYFLLVAFSQIIPSLRIGYLSTYIAPLVFVLAVTLGKEASDDIARRRRDAEANKEEYTILQLRPEACTDADKGRQNSKLRMRSRALGARQVSQYTRLDSIEEEEEDLEGDTETERSNITIEKKLVRSRDLKVGDVVELGKDQRVPADLVILKSYTSDTTIANPVAAAMKKVESSVPSLLVEDVDNEVGSLGASMDAVARQAQLDSDSHKPGQAGDVGEAFIRTDQLDGETDWKLRLAPPITQQLDPKEFMRLRIIAGKPDRNVHDFVGTLEYTPRAKLRMVGDVQLQQEVLSTPLTIDNTAWANTVLASNATVLAVIVYTGAQTRQALSTSASRSKSGLLEHEINNLTKILCALTLTLSIALVAVRGAEGRPGEQWYVAVLKFLVLFSTIVPISLRVNLDMGKTVYARFIERDQGIPDTVVRTSTIPEELGRIEYLLSDKTGTLTQNEMDLRKIHVGTVSYANEAMDEVRSYIRQMYSTSTTSDALQSSALVTPSSAPESTLAGASNTRSRREISSRVRDLVLALALCHNVTPTSEEIEGKTITTYQASSPDEIAIVQWAESVGLRLVHRDRHYISLQSVDTAKVVVRVKIMEVFPFTSAGKRMGIILQFLKGDLSTVSMADGLEEIWFYQKGADTVMGAIVAANDWLDEETANMAREGLRTLVVGRKKLSMQQYRDFATKYRQASLSLYDRDAGMSTAVREFLEHDLELLGVTGVEDKLQRDVRPSLELLRNAGVKIWMLTGDKVETAKCVAVSAKLVSRTQYIHTVTQISSASGGSAAQDALSIIRSKPDSTALLIDGDSLSYFLINHRNDFISLAVQLPAVIACRCSPTQKADVAYLIRQFTKKRVACIGDGGNDVSMIQAADIGVGIVGKEGRQASLAADFSITSFHHLTKLLVWHGRNSYKRSAKLAQFVIHRGLIISVCQTFYSVATELQPHALYRDWLLVGYATVYTMAPVFSLVLDKDVDEGLANLYPELYKELTLGKSLSYKTFFIWVAVSVYQGGIIQGCSQLLVDRDSDRMVSVSFTVLVVNELVMVAFEVVTWHWIMYVSILGTAMIYVGSIPFLGDYFDLEFVWGWQFAWRVAAISALSLIPPYSIKLLRRTLHPPNYRKVQGM
ncbi:uncharacterized protein KY384_003671 [Bacidia gigantensis]|uniref:uncharacterized protein n=1 Tax=Bacidia gigantensis TaxID=2732470 RepID=UPI001D04BCC9|nr:uncharacterized protein KY384_003671 [Bacidia gigantensis]KAG8532035.1 hypothetical protein KY384_003671 [Bacidia gigantensis]